ncbi:replication-relaxation family protein [Streptomyces sp. DH10]|uniref:replication-relaxation family protein n=1 Tax=Streptomyces sp. DH10 TaxID=3040121 RepID=UPI002441E6E9|nr:replication-relaxation family protein [Streptomyces sp. DH10]MDG9714885.1 replication-relaxation family protein [Streptomyces sp. DH10]
MTTPSPWTDPWDNPAEPAPPSVPSAYPRTPWPAPSPAAPAGPADSAPRSGHDQGHDKQPDTGPNARPAPPEAPKDDFPGQDPSEPAGADADSFPVGPPAGLPTEILAAQVLGALASIRVATPAQLHQLLTPHHQGNDYVRRVLRQLRSEGLADRIDRRGRVKSRWFLTEPGLEMALALDFALDRGRLVTGEKVASSLAAWHALAVTQSAIAFHRHGVGTLGDWEVEVAHTLPRHQSLVADALVHLPYTNLPHVFVEVDRASMTFGKLTAKLTAYDEYRTNVWKSTGKQEWLTRYPRSEGIFPPVLFVFDGAGATALDNRIAVLLAAAHQLAAVHTGKLTVAATTLAKLDHHGPRAEIWRYPLPRRAGHLGTCTLPDLPGMGKPTARSGLPSQIKS